MRSDASHAAASLRTAVYTLRTHFGLGDSAFTNPVELPPGLVETDIARFEDTLNDGRLDDAVALWRGPLLDRFALTGATGWDDWVDARRTHLEKRFGTALRREAHRHREAGDPAAALPYLEKAAEVQPHRLEHHLALIEALMELHDYDRAEAAVVNARLADERGGRPARARRARRAAAHATAR